MQIYLVQHGKARGKDVDPARHLTEEGASDVKRIARVAKDYNISVSKIIHSEKARARETAEIFASFLSPAGGASESTGLNPNDSVKNFISNTELSDRLMIVGHLPFMTKLTSYLLTGSEELQIFNFQKGGILCLNKEDAGSSWIIKWSLMPQID